MTDKDKNKEESKEETTKKDIPKKCGIVMPISSMDGYPESHWKDIRNILTSAINDAGFEARIVSESDDIGVIHQRIVQNLYDNPMIVCDISGRNPNVMFELGLRLAFDKPTIIVKDEVTQYSFDTSVIEHLTYPKDLRDQKIENFRAELTERIVKTYQKFIDNPSEYSTFLKHFGSFKVPEIKSSTIPADEYIIEELKNIRIDLDEIKVKSREKRSQGFKTSEVHSIKDAIVKKIYIPVYSLNDYKDKELKLKQVKLIENIHKGSNFNRGTEFIIASLDQAISVDMALELIKSIGVHAGVERITNDSLYIDDIPF